MKQVANVFLFLTLLCYFACNNPTAHKVPESVAEQAFDLKVNRFDKDLFALKTDSQSIPQLKKLASAYPDFFYLFTKRIINIGDSSNPQMPGLLHGFLHDRYINEMYQEVSKQYADVSEYNRDLTAAFKAYHYFFPEAKIPEITYFVSGYNYASITTATTLGIGLEMYLGNRYEPYTLLEIPAYKQQMMCKEYIVNDALQSWISTEFEKEEDYKSLLHQMLFRGKVMYTIEKLLPDMPDSIRMGYTAAQLKWCNEFEPKIWSHFVEKKLLFAALRGDSFKYINEGPFTAGLPRESPGKIGVWVGYQIIKKYAEQHPEVSLKQLFANYNAQQLLTQSKYKPK
jgi:hypothetical protein